ncbi:MAG: hypothetical protein KIG88_08790 [Weeksellaceae bacterium]|nr:hypothetical protein [Weeksellaceae bacterium]
MKKLTLLISLVTTIAFAQNKRELPIFPGCENHKNPKALLDCFNSNLANFTKNYFISNQNILNYFQYPGMSNKINFRLNEEGKFKHKQTKEESLVFNLMSKDLIEMYNLFLAHQNKIIIPAKNEEGKSVGLNFSLPVKYSKVGQTFNATKEVIRFTIVTDQKYLIKQNSKYEFVVYNEKGNVVSSTNSMTDFYSLPIFSEVVKKEINLITEKDVDGKKIKLEIENLFRNQKEKFSITYYENGNLIKEFNTMDKFLKSDQSKYIY